MEERRKARRMKLESTITVKRIDSGMEKEVTIDIKDLSKSGIGFYCSEQLEVGAIYQSSVIIWTKEIIPALLKIVRKVEEEDKNFYGAEFMGLSEIDIFRISVYEELDKLSVFPGQDENE